MSALSFARHVRAAKNVEVHRPVGVVVEVVGLMIEIAGIKGGIGDVVEIVGEGSTSLDAEVSGFRDGRLLATPLGPIAGVRPGAKVIASRRGACVAVGESLLGRVVDAFGVPIDGKGRARTSEMVPVSAAPPPAVARRPIADVLVTGVRVLDGMTTLGKGQRVGIFAGAGVGKTTLLGMLSRSSEADVNVIALVGERGRELNEFLRDALGPDGLARSIVVVATSDQPPLVRARAAGTATAIAEHFRDAGKNVLLVMDSVTRYAMALREAALATGEPPATKGYPPSVFAALPRLLERAGTTSGPGSITAIYTVLVEGDDLTDPIADSVRSILDGHIVLSRALAEKGHFPAVDVLASLSRLCAQVAPERLQRAQSRLRELSGAWRDAQDLVQVGAYVPGSDARVDLAQKIVPKLEALLRQATNERASFDATAKALIELAEIGA